MTAPAIDLNSTEEQLIAHALYQVEARYAFLKTDNILSPPTKEQIQLSIQDALDEINSAPPQTFHTMQQVLVGNDTRWKALLVIGAAKGVLQLRVVEWAANGYSSPIEDLPIESKLQDYETALERIKSDFSDRLAMLKSTSQKVIARANAGGSNPMLGGHYQVSGRVYRR